MPVRWLGYWLLVGCVGALLAHLAMIARIPAEARGDATSRILALGAPNRMIEAAALGDAIPFADASALVAYCPFDIGENPVLLTAPAGGAPLSIVFLGQGGSVFAAVTDRAATRGLVQARLLTQPQLLDLIDAEDPDAPPTELRIVAPVLRGAIVVKALVATPARREEAATALAAARCAPA
jgi:uncharacterized membrane protein